MSQAKVHYTAKAHTTGGREGVSHTDDNRLSVELVRPGSRDAGTNPEQLFAIGWSACYLSALALVADKMKVAFSAPPSDNIEVDLLVSDEGEASLRARHSVTLPGVNADKARVLIEEAHRTCPYSKAVRGNIDVETRIL
jgi:lipoyl-dependent peroxiredoxin